jgi:EpsI family protein
MTARVLVLIGVVLAASATLTESRPAARPLPLPFATFPRDLAGWRGVDAAPLDPQVAAVLGADDYLNRVYRDPQEGAVSVWVAFYGAQRHGDAIHSPANCLPGNGWTPVSHQRTQLRAGGEQLPVNRYVVQKRGDRQVVTYWFQGRGRVVASEYANKALLLFDAVRLHRTDGALVRLVAPVVASEAQADSVIEKFAAALQPQLARWIP